MGESHGRSRKRLREELLDSQIEVVQIGPAGEKLVRFACIINRCSRANGRNGTGAVMGSKNLKAVVVHRKKLPKPADEKGFGTLTSNVLQRIRDNPNIEALSSHGTDVDLQGLSECGFLPTANYSSGYFPEGAKSITGTTMTETILKKRESCHGCAIACKRVVEIPGMVDPAYGGPEYETCAAFGSYCRVADLAVIAQANQLCNKYGMDTISCGAAVAFAMECFESGILQTVGSEVPGLKFGNGHALLKLVENIAKRQGIGDLLAEGTARAAKILGNKAESLTVTVKGQELPAHMPQYKPAVGLLYAVNPFGADHQSCEHDVWLTMPADSLERSRLAQLGHYQAYERPNILDEDKVRFAYDTQCFYSMMDTLCLCQFAWGPAWQLYGPTELIEMLRYGIGWETSLHELMRIGERRINMMRFFNTHEGFNKEDDVLPERVFQAMPEGPSRGTVLSKADFEAARVLYYAIAGWDEQTGKPKPGVLSKLSLGWLTGAGKKSTEADTTGETTAETDMSLIEWLSLNGLYANAAVWINGRQVMQQEYGKARLQKGDRIRIIQPLGGG